MIRMPEHKDSTRAETVTRGTIGDRFLFFIRKALKANEF